MAKKPKKPIVIKDGKCPVCGGNLESENGMIDCGVVLYDSWCTNENCDFSGTTRYAMVFNGHFDAVTCIDYPVESGTENQTFKEVK